MTGSARRARRVIRRIGLVALGAGLLAVAGFVLWAESPMRAEPGPLAAVRADPSIGYRDDGTTVVLTPKRPNGAGLVFLAGARVDAPAYAWKLSGVADAGVTVVIVRPVLNFALFDPRPLREFESAAPAVRRWAVGGHSLGGVRACQYAADPVAGLVLLGSYCANDLSGSAVPVLSLSGSRDGLSTPAKIRDAAHLLPSDATFVEIPGADHARFGDYGAQPGDRTATASDATVERAITGAVLALLRR